MPVTKGTQCNITSCTYNESTGVIKEALRLRVSRSMLENVCIGVCLRLLLYLCNCIHVTGDSPVTGLYTNKIDLICFDLLVSLLEILLPALKSIALF